jgi:hypothetical protein
LIVAKEGPRTGKGIINNLVDRMRECLEKQFFGIDFQGVRSFGHKDAYNGRSSTIRPKHARVLRQFGSFVRRGEFADYTADTPIQLIRGQIIQVVTDAHRGYDSRTTAEKGLGRISLGSEDACVG